MATVEQAQANLAILEEALAQGVLSVTFSDGRAVTFSSFEELVQRWHFWARLAGAESGRQRLLGEFKKGVSA